MTSPPDPPLAELLDRAAEAMLDAGRPGVALTGAGISVESGIPDFRSPGGIWERFDPYEYATIDAFRSDPVKVWRFLVELDELLVGAAPNPGHDALSALERLGLLGAVVTQNVDGLHQAAGSQDVIEYHGNGRRLVCLDCRAARDASAGRGGEGHPPRCPCGSILKPDVVLFGEAIPPAAHRRAIDAVAGAGFLLVVGTSATVSPCSELPHLARRSGVPVLEVNLDETHLTRSVALLALRGSAGRILPELVARIEDRIPGRG